MLCGVSVKVCAAANACQKFIIALGGYHRRVISAKLKRGQIKVCAYLESLKDDISLFCKKFDYRFDSLPWGESKDSVERSIKFLGGEDSVK